MDYIAYILYTWQKQVTLQWTMAGPQSHGDAWHSACSACSACAARESHGLQSTHGISGGSVAYEVENDQKLWIDWKRARMIRENWWKWCFYEIFRSRYEPRYNKNCFCCVAFDQRVAPDDGPQARPVMVKNPDGSITQHWPQYQAVNTPMSVSVTYGRVERQGWWSCKRLPFVPLNVKILIFHSQKERQFLSLQTCCGCTPSGYLQATWHTQKDGVGLSQAIFPTLYFMSEPPPTFTSTTPKMQLMICFMLSTTMIFFPGRSMVIPHSYFGFSGCSAASARTPAAAPSSTEKRGSGTIDGSGELGSVQGVVWVLGVVETVCIKIW